MTPPPSTGCSSPRSIVDTSWALLVYLGRLAMLCRRRHVQWIYCCLIENCVNVFYRPFRASTTLHLSHACLHAHILSGFLTFVAIRPVLAVILTSLHNRGTTANDHSYNNYTKIETLVFLLFWIIEASNALWPPFLGTARRQ